MEELLAAQVKLLGAPDALDDGAVRLGAALPARWPGTDAVLPESVDDDDYDDDDEDEDAAAARFVAMVLEEEALEVRCFFTCVRRPPTTLTLVSTGFAPTLHSAIARWRDGAHPPPTPRRRPFPTRRPRPTHRPALSAGPDHSAGPRCGAAAAACVCAAADLGP